MGIGIEDSFGIHGDNPGLLILDQGDERAETSEGLTPEDRSNSWALLLAARTEAQQLRELIEVIINLATSMFRGEDLRLFLIEVNKLMENAQRKPDETPELE